MNQQHFLLESSSSATTEAPNHDKSLEDVSTATDTQEKILALLPILPAMLSVWGSFTIMHLVYTGRNTNASAKSTTGTSCYRRILFGLSVCDFISSAVIPWQAFLVPAATSPRVWAIGTPQTCSGLGFLQQLAFSNIWYNGCLSCFFLLTVRWGVKEQVLARRYEPWMHLFSLGYPLITACVGLGMGVYDEVELGQGCWVTNYPKGCEAECPDDGFADGDCCLSPQIAWAFAGIPSFLSFMAILMNNLVVYCHVRRTIPRNADDNNNNNNNTSRKRVQAVATQASLYVGGFLLCYLPSMSLRIMESLNFDAQDEYKLFPLLVLQSILLPLQGCLNCFIFIRPTYLRVRKTYPQQSRFWALRRALYGDKVKPTDFGSSTDRNGMGGSSANHHNPTNPLVTQTPSPSLTLKNSPPTPTTMASPSPKSTKTIHSSPFTVVDSWGDVNTSNVSEYVFDRDGQKVEEAPHDEEEERFNATKKPSGMFRSKKKRNNKASNHSSSAGTMSSSSWGGADVSDVNPYGASNHNKESCSSWGGVDVSDADPYGDNESTSSWGGVDVSVIGQDGNHTEQDDYEDEDHGHVSMFHGKRRKKRTVHASPRQSRPKQLPQPEEAAVEEPSEKTQATVLEASSSSINDEGDYDEDAVEDPPEPSESSHRPPSIFPDEPNEDELVIQESLAHLANELFGDDNNGSDDD